MASEPVGRPTAPQRYLLWCVTCGRTEDRSGDEVAGFVRDGWPRCCDAAMSYLARPDAPRAVGDTALERPALSGDTALDKPALPPS